MGYGLHGIGFVLILAGGELASARRAARPAWLWGLRDPLTGGPAPSTRVTGHAVLATGAGLVLVSWVGTVGIWAGVVGVCLLALSAVLHVWAAQMRGSLA
jgi:hypothetical protein